MAVTIEVVRGSRWKPKRVRPTGERLMCETLREACRAMKQLLADGEPCARARSNEHVLLWGCRNPDGAVSIGGPKGLSHHDPMPTA